MAISNYSELSTAVGNWLARGDLATYIPDFIALGENRVYRKLRVRQMETALSDTIANGVIAVPSGYVAMKQAYVDGSPTSPLFPTTLENLYAQYPTRSAYGRPRVFAREGANFIFGPYPDSGYTVKGVYYKKLDPLSDSNSSNWLTTDVPDLILFASLLEAALFVKNEAEARRWELRFSATASDVQEQDDAEEASGGVLRPRAG